jgi:alpha-beta hydrolase superfamily lysophospholipase
MTTLLPQIVPWLAPDGAQLFARVWSPLAPPRGRVVYLHGVMSHGGWFTRSCRRLAEAGLEVHFLDRRGSGLNLADRGDAATSELWLADVEHYLRQLPTDLPRTLLGLSWGGKLAAAVAVRSPQLVDRLGLLYPGLYAKVEAAGWQRMLLSLAASVGLSRRRVAIPLSDARWFTDDPRQQAFVERDPLAIRNTTLRFLLANLELDRQVPTFAARLHMPTLVMLAGRDQIVDNARVRRFFDEIPSPAKKLVEYPTAAHTLEFEPDPQPFLEDLAGWATTP